MTANLKDLSLSPFAAQLIQIIESHCATTAMALLFPDQGGALHVELRRQDNEIVFFYGYKSEGIKDWFISRASNHQPSRLIIRSLTAEIDPATQLRIKELRGYDIRQDRLLKLNADEVARLWCDSVRLPALSLRLPEGRQPEAEGRESVDHVARVEAIRFC